MEQEFENGIMYRMMPDLTNEQAMVLKQTLEAINKESNLTMTNDHIIEPFDVLMGDDMFPLADKSNDKFPLTLTSMPSTRATLRRWFFYPTKEQTVLSM